MNRDQCNRLITTRVLEPGAGRLQSPQTPCRYIIARVNESIYCLITLGTLLKSLFTNLPIFWALGAGSCRLRNPNYNLTPQLKLLPNTFYLPYWATTLYIPKKSSHLHTHTHYSEFLLVSTYIVENIELKFLSA